MNEIYKCPYCGWSPAENEIVSDWEHCPNCLCSVHTEDEDGYECGGALEPVAIRVRADDKPEIIQRCRLCGEMKISPIHEDDNPIKILSVAARPLSSPAFPIEQIEEMTRMMGGSGDVGGYYEPRK